MRRLKPCGFCLLAVLGPLCAQQYPDPARKFGWPERLDHYLYRTYSWQRMVSLAGDTAFDHLLFKSEEWTRGPQGFTHHYGLSVSKRIVRNSIELGAGALFDEDIRFTASHARGLRKRLWRSVAQVFVTAHKQGAGMAYSRLAGTAGGALIIATWQPGSLSASRFFADLGSGYLGHLQNSLLAEFEPDLKAVGRNLKRRLFRGRSVESRSDRTAQDEP
jgi:hypothetical protein